MRTASCRRGSRSEKKGVLKLRKNPRTPRGGKGRTKKGARLEKPLLKNHRTTNPMLLRSEQQEGWTDRGGGGRGTALSEKEMGLVESQSST